MTDIQFSKEEKTILIGKLQDYFDAELHRELGQFEAEFLLDFIARQMGAYFYNRGLYDAQVILSDRMESIADAIYDIEKPTDLMR